MVLAGTFSDKSSIALHKMPLILFIFHSKPHVPYFVELLNPEKSPTTESSAWILM